VIRRKVVLDRLDRLDAKVDGVATAVEHELGLTRHQAVAKMEHAERRVAAATTQAESRVAAVYAEAKGELAELSRRAIDERKALADDCRSWREDAVEAYRQRDELVGAVAELQRRIELLTIERDEARRQHDECRGAVEAARDERDATHRRLAAVEAAAWVIFEHGDHEVAIAARPRGGSRTRTRARFAALADAAGWHPPD
jgi:chromosome segregation ATPase